MSLTEVLALMGIHLNGSLTPVTKSVAGYLDLGHVGIKKLAVACGTEWYHKRVRGGVLQKAQNQADVNAILAGEKVYADGIVRERRRNEPPQDPIFALTLSRQLEDARSLLEALQEVEAKIRQASEEEFSKDPLSFEFFSRWRKEVESVDDRDVRNMWTSILTDEIKKPGSISLRTLDVLRNMSRQEAEIFQKVVQGAIMELIPSDSNGHCQYANYAEVLRLSEAGLLTMETSERTYNLQYKRREGSGTLIHIDRSDMVLCTAKTPFKASGYFLTNAGVTLLRYAPQSRSIDSIIALAKYIAARSSDTKFGLFHSRRLNEHQITWNPSLPIWSNGDVS